jgi:hypothetical protein
MIARLARGQTRFYGTLHRVIPKFFLRGPVMPERSEKLKATIAELERELHAAGEVDAETRAMLLETVEEIQSALHVNTAAAASEPHTLTERLNHVALGFDASHPTMASLVRRVVDALAQLGI